MTITVYRVRPDGTRTGILSDKTIQSGNPERLPGSIAYPPCACPRCRTAKDPYR